MAEISIETQQEIAQVVKLRDEKDLTFPEIAKAMGFSESTAKRRYRASILLQTAVATTNGTDIAFPTAEELKLPEIGDYLTEDKQPIERFRPLQRFGDAVVIFDLHIPLHDPRLLNRMINAARVHDIRSLIIGGDFFHMDTFGSFLPYQPEASLGVERVDGNVVMKTLLRHFDEIDVIWGNHDFRLVKKLGFQKSFEDCMRWMLSGLSEDEHKKIRVSDLDYMYYYPGGEIGQSHAYRICHPRDFSSVPLNVGRKLATKYNCSIMCGHSHHFAMGTAINGYDIVIEGGGFFDKNRTEYIQKTTTHHEWVQGFTFFKKGVPTLVGPAFGNHLQY